MLSRPIVTARGILLQHTSEKNQSAQRFDLKRQRESKALLPVAIGSYVQAKRLAAFVRQQAEAVESEPAISEETRVTLKTIKCLADDVMNLP